MADSCIAGDGRAHESSGARHDASVFIFLSREPTPCYKPLGIFVVRVHETGGCYTRQAFIPLSAR